MTFLTSADVSRYVNLADEVLNCASRIESVRGGEQSTHKGDNKMDAMEEQLDVFDRLQSQGSISTADYWVLATVGEVRVIQGDFDEAQKWYKAAVGARQPPMRASRPRGCSSSLLRCHRERALSSGATAAAHPLVWSKTVVQRRDVGHAVYVPTSVFSTQDDSRSFSWTWAAVCSVPPLLPSQALRMLVCLCLAGNGL